ncbi:MAG: hypothetical protein Q4A61_06500 [Porphyromonadaceae bacterium]|nr:hypothetical protein [Porphyromonadaceae bacterium]
MMLSRLASLRRACSSLFTILCLLSCSSGGWRKLSKDEILSTLPELNLLSASLNERGATDSVRQRAYHEFFDRRGYHLSDWDSTMAWYAKHRVRLFHDFYRLSVDSLTRLRTVLEKKRDLIAQSEQRERLWHGAILDSVNLLQDSSAYYYSGELLNKSFELIPSTPYDSTTHIYAEILALSLGPFPSDSLSLELRLHLSDTTSVVSLRHITASGRYSILAQVPGGKYATRVTGSLRGLIHSTDSSVLWVAPFRCFKYSSGGTTDELTISKPEVYQDASADWGL